MRTTFYLLVLSALVTLKGRTQSVVKISDGLISGIEQNGITSYKGIPFAAPPIEGLRWKAPQPPKKWQGILKCDRFSASAMQPTPTPYQMWTEEFIPPVTPLSEDCLYLNVWTPANPTTEKLPVIVWIHGGAFFVGSGSCPVYDGAGIAKKNVVFVTINYRLGVFGFMAHPDLSLESGKNASGNYGLLDQIAALKWVKKNIAAFGGDPSNITIAGQSAGSMSVELLMLSPLAKGLFHKAIAQSGGIPFELPARQLGTVETRGERVMAALHVKSLAALRTIPAAEILKAVENFPFSPVYDGYVIPKDPIAHIKAHRQNDVPLLAGWAAGDASVAGKTNVTPGEFKAQAFTAYGDHADEFLKIFPAGNQNEVTRSRTNYALCKFAAFSNFLLATHGKNEAYLYNFTFVPTDKPGLPNYGAFHSADIAYALNTLYAWNRPWQARDRNLEQVMSDYWVNFARNGNPNGNNLPVWQRYTASAGEVLELGDEIIMRPARLKSELNFLQREGLK